MYVNITDRDGVLLGRIDIAGMDLRRPGAQHWLGAEIAQEMGTDAVEQCATMPDLAACKHCGNADHQAHHGDELW